MRSRLPALPIALRLAPPLLAVTSCTAPPPPPLHPAGQVLRATIVAVRPLVPAGPILTALGASPAGTGPDAAREFILRTEDGRILSVVQEEAERGRWQPGQAVSVIGGDHAHLAAHSVADITDATIKDGG